MSLGMHTIPIHYTSFNYMEKVRPQLIVTLSQDPEYLSMAFSLLAEDGLLALRHYPEENEAVQFDKVLADPVGYGKWHAEWWHTKLVDVQERQRHRGLPVIDLNRVTVLHVNEMPVWMPEHLPKIISTEKSFLYTLNTFSLSGAALGLNTGHPALLDGNGIPIWDGFMDLQPALSSGPHYMAFHEYWPHGGPQADWGYLAGRFIHCPLQAPYLITECGVDEYTVDDGLPKERRGWRAWLSPEEFTKQLKWYYDQVASTGRAAGIAPYTWDGANWQSFDMQPAEDTILGRHWPSMHYTFDWGEEPDAGGNPDGESGSPYPDWMRDDLSEVSMTIADATNKLAMASGIEPEALMAVLKVETNLKDKPSVGKPVVRLEAHILERLIPSNKKHLFEDSFRIGGPKPWEGHSFKNYDDEWVFYHGSQDTEREALNVASDLFGMETALRSTSMGLGQVMGFNYAMLKYSSATQMYQAFAKEDNGGIYNQIVGVFSYILSVNGLIEAIRAKDWREVARLYNGPGAVDVVSTKLRAAYESFVGYRTFLPILNS